MVKDGYMLYGSKSISSLFNVSSVGKSCGMVHFEAGKATYLLVLQKKSPLKCVSEARNRQSSYIISITVLLGKSCYLQRSWKCPLAVILGFTGPRSK